MLGFERVGMHSVNDGALFLLSVVAHVNIKGPGWKMMPGWWLV